MRRGSGTGGRKPEFDYQLDPAHWPSLREKLTAIFRSRTKAEWSELMEHSDLCYAPVLSMAEAPSHPHNVARCTFVEAGGVLQPAPAPRYSLTQADMPRMFDGESNSIEAFLASERA